MALFLMNKGNVIGLNNIYLQLNGNNKNLCISEKCCEKIKKNI